MEGKLFVVSGPSGAGKGTICKSLLAQKPEIYFSVSCATRAPRPGEIDGVHYFFISEARFEELRKSGGLMECAQFNGGNWYGTPKDNVLRQLAVGKSVLLEIENNGAQQVIRQYPETVSVFILPPDRETLIRRLVDRGTEDLPKLTRRIEKVKSELEAAKGYTYLLLNDDVARATERLKAVFEGTYRTEDAQRQVLEQLIRQFSDTDEAISALTAYYQKTRTNE